MHKKQYLPFKEARNFVRELNLKSANEWWDYCKSGIKPVDIPSCPRHIYLKAGWRSFGDWLGTGRTLHQYNWMPFKKARNFARGLNLNSIDEWWAYCNKKEKPYNIPSAPNRVKDYKGQWVSWHDWLDEKRFISANCIPFKKARQLARSLKLKNSNEWWNYCSSQNRSLDLASRPDRTYKDEWTDWGDWLGTGNTCRKRNHYLSFEQAREVTRKLGFKNVADWLLYCKSGNKPSNIPSAVKRFYIDQWVSWADWLNYAQK